MKKLLLSLGMAAMVSSFALAEPIEIEFGAATSSQNPWKSKNETITRNGQDWSIDIQGQDSPYFGAEWTSKNDTWKGFQFGKGKAAISGMTVSTTIPGKVTKVVVNSAAGSGDGTKWDMSVAVGETAFSCNDAASTALTDSQADYTFTGSASGTVVIKWANTGNSTKALYYRNITITYEAEAGVVSAPTMNPAAGWIMQGETVALSAQEGASIFYTTDTNEPTEASTAYTEPIAINNDMTIKAIARLNDVNSAVKEAAYTVYPVNSAEAPLTTDQAIELIDKSFDQNIEVFVNGTITEVSKFDSRYGSINYTILTEGANNSLEIYSGKNVNGDEFTDISQLAVGDKVVVKGKLKNYNDTKEMDMNNVIISIEKAPNSIETPVFSKEAGVLSVGDVVTITCATDGAKIYYTLDNSDPTTSSTEYTENGILFSKEGEYILKAIAAKGTEISDIATVEYLVEDPNAKTRTATIIFANQGWEPGAAKLYKSDNTIEWTANNGMKFTTTATSVGQTYPAYFDSKDPKGLRLYGSGSNKNTITVEAPQNYILVSVSTDKDAKFNGSETATNANETFTDFDKNKTKFTFAPAEEATVAYSQMTIVLESVQTAVETIEAEDAAPARYFNLQGVEVANPANGLYIKVQGKKATKVIL